jgi:hypothetical protein
MSGDGQLDLQEPAVVLVAGRDGQPAGRLVERRGDQRVDPAAAVGHVAHEAALAQHPQELAPHRVGDRPATSSTPGRVTDGLRVKQWRNGYADGSAQLSITFTALLRRMGR